MVYSKCWRYALIFLFFFKIGYCNETIEKGIEKLQKDIDVSYSLQLAEIINNHSLRYNIDWRIVVAIFKMESNFNMKAVNYKSRDFGIGQINAINMLYHDFDLGKQMTDLDYAVNNTFYLLYKLKSKYNTGSKGYLQWFTRYHSFTPYYRKRYYLKLRKYLKALDYMPEREGK